MGRRMTLTTRLTRLKRSLLSLTLMAPLATASSSLSQEDVPRARILWQKKFGDYVWHRQFVPGFSEPDVGISSDPTRENPVRMLCAQGIVYILDNRGDIERTFPFKKRSDIAPWMNDYATTSPDGQFYVVYSILMQSNSPELHSLRAFNPNGDLRFELSQSQLLGPDKEFANGTQGVYIAPKGDYLVVFSNGFHHGFPYLNFYDAKGSVIKKVGADDFAKYDFGPLYLSFSPDGSRVLLSGFKAEDRLVFDSSGNMTGRVADAQALGAARRARDAIKRLLDPEAVETRLQRGALTGGIAEFRLIRDGRQGVYAKDGVLYWFELEWDPKGGQDEVR